MPTQRHRTVIELDVDDRKIRGLDRTLHRAFDDQMLSAFERVLDRSARTIEAMTKAAERFEAVMKRTAGGGGPTSGAGGRVPVGGGAGGAGGGGDLANAIRTLNRNIQQLGQQQQRAAPAGGGGGGGPGFFGRAAATGVGSYLGGLGRNLGSGGEGFFAQMAGGVPVVGGMVQGAINAIHRYANMHAAAQQQISRTVGTLGRSTVSGPFTRFGLAAPEAMQTAMQFAQMAGRSGEGVSSQLMTQGLDMQMLGGIQGAPGIMRAAETGGGFTMGTEMQESVSAGIQMGIREARLGQFIGVATQVLEQARLEGTGTELQTVLRTMTGFAGLGAGFVGEQGQRAGMQAMGALRRFQPGQDVASLVGLRAVGYGQPGGPSYHEALEMFQEEPARVMPMLLRTIRGMAPGNEDAQIELMRQIAPRLMGFTPSIQQSRRMVQGDLSAFGREVGPEDAQAFIERRREAVGGAFGVARQEASLRNRQLQVGAQTYGASRGMMRREAGLAETVLPRIASGIEAIFGWLQQQWNAIRQDPAAWIRGIVRGAMEGLFPDMPELPDTGEVATDARNALVRAGGGAQYMINEVFAAGAEAVGATDAANQFRRTGASGRRMMQGAQDTPPAPSGPGVTGPVTPGPTVPGGGTEPEADAAAAVRRARDELDTAAVHLDRLRLPAEGSVATG